MRLPPLSRNHLCTPKLAPTTCILGTEPPDWPLMTNPPRFDVREYEPARDATCVAAMERLCEVGGGGSGKAFLFTDLLGDPTSRVRNSPAFLVLVAELLEDDGERSTREVVGVIRGCVKTVTCGVRTARNGKRPSPLYAKVAYILGLRVSPHHRRKGVALGLVTRLEGWFRTMGAEYSYMATDSGNEASVGLFTARCGYSRFRTPSILVQPVHAHRARVARSARVIRLGATEAETLYRLRFQTTEFFPRDIGDVLRNPLSLGTYLAVPRGAGAWPGSAEAFLADPPGSWAVVSVWNCKDVFRLELRGVPRLTRVLARTTRVVDRTLPWLRIPSVPNLFEPFGLYFMYGLGGEGPAAAGLVTALCAHAHNMAREGGCRVVATEVAGGEPLRAGVPHWRKLSCEEDLWCVKRLGEEYSDGAVGDWTKSKPGTSIFVDPREF